MVHHTMCYYGATIKNEVGGCKDGSVAKNVYCYSRRPELHSQNPYRELTSQEFTRGRNSSSRGSDSTCTNIHIYTY